MDVPTHTPPPAPEPQLAYLPTYDEELDETAHLGPLPISLLVIQAALAALQNEEQQLLADPRSEDCLKCLNDVLHAFVADKYAPQPEDPYPAGDQAYFTPQAAAEQLPGSQVPLPHLPEPVYTAADFEAQGAENATRIQVSPVPLSDTSSDAGSGSITAEDGAPESAHYNPGDEEQDSVSLSTGTGGSLHAEQPDEDASGSISQRAPSPSIAADVIDATTRSRTVQQPLPAVVPLLNYTLGASRTAGSSHLPNRAMPQTPAGISALAYLSELCTIPESKRDLENALVEAVRFVMKKNGRGTENNVHDTDDLANSGSGTGRNQQRISLEASRIPMSGESKILSSEARGGKITLKGVRGIVSSIRRTLHVGTS